MDYLNKLLKVHGVKGPSSMRVAYFSTTVVAELEGIADDDNLAAFIKAVRSEATSVEKVTLASGIVNVVFIFKTEVCDATDD